MMIDKVALRSVLPKNFIVGLDAAPPGLKRNRGSSLLALLPSVHMKVHLKFMHSLLVFILSLDACFEWGLISNVMYHDENILH